MKIVLLAAGRSRRMQPIPDKNFLLFLGKPLIVHQLEALLGAGFNDFIVVGGAHNLEKLQEVKSLFGTTKMQIIEQENLDDGMAGALISLKDILDDEPVCIVSSNDVVDKSAYKTALDAYKLDGFDSYIIGKKMDKYFPGGYLEAENDGLIKSIVEKPGEGNEPSNLVNIVIHIHKHPGKLIEKMRKVDSDRDDKYEVALDNLIGEGMRMKAIPFDNFWQPVKYPWDVFKVMNYFFKGLESKISNKADIADSAIIKGDVIIEEGARIYDNAIINGPAYIGKNVIVANNSLVRSSIVNEGSVVGYSTEIARSYLGKDVWTHTNYIGDSVISDNCSFGSGTVTGNLRLDESDIAVNIRGEKCSSGTNKFGLITGESVRVGINSSFMPGVKIGSDCMIGAGIIIPRDIPENSFVKGKVQLEIKENMAILDDKKRGEMKKNLKGAR